MRGGAVGAEVSPQALQSGELSALLQRMLGRTISIPTTKSTMVVPRRTLRALPFQGSSAVTSGGQLKYWPRDSLRVNCRQLHLESALVDLVPVQVLMD